MDCSRGHKICKVKLNGGRDREFYRRTCDKVQAHEKAFLVGIQWEYGCNLAQNDYFLINGVFGSLRFSEDNPSYDVYSGV